MTDDASSFLRPGVADLVLHEGKTFHQYTDTWDTAPRYSIASDRLRPEIAEAARYYRLAFRDIAQATNERTMIACIVPPGVVFGHTATVEKAPWARATADALVLCALFNSFPFDWLVRQKAATHLSLYILEALPVPRFNESQHRFLARAALILSCNHIRYTALWREQTGKRAIPNLDRPGARSAMRARIDAVVAEAYSLDRNGYRHVLDAFSHRSDPDAAARCLDAFDTLQAKGIKHWL
jgi:hypothetical protein